VAGTERKCLAMKAELLDTAARAHATSLGRLPLIQAAVTGKCACAKLNVALIIVCLDFVRPLSLPHQQFSTQRWLGQFMDILHPSLDIFDLIIIKQSLLHSVPVIYPSCFILWLLSKFQSRWLLTILGCNALC